MSEPAPTGETPVSHPGPETHATDSGERPSTGAATPADILCAPPPPDHQPESGLIAARDRRAPVRKGKRRAARPAVRPNGEYHDAWPARRGDDGESQDADPTEEALLAQLQRGAQYCQQIQQQLAQYAGPELDAIVKLHRMIILKLSTRAESQPELWDVLKDLMKPVMDWARLQEQQKDREFAERKHRDQMEAEKAAANPLGDPAATALTPETLEKIERELKLL